jgi:hypothetical protein
MRKSGSLVVLLLLSCSGTTAQRQAEQTAVEALDPCRQDADDAFWKVVESCEERGLKYDDCPELPAAEQQMADDYKECP